MRTGDTMGDPASFWHWLWHGLSLGTIVGAVIGWLPAIAALAAFVWYVINVYESKTMQTWMRARRERKIAHHRLKILRLKSAIRRQTEDDAPYVPFDID